MPPEILPAPNVLTTLATLRTDARQAILALSILIDRIGQLPVKDRNDLFELLQEWRTVNGAKERQFIESAMQEIVARPDISTTKIDATPPPIEGKRKSWAVHVGKQMRKLREDLGMTQSAIAEKTGIPQSHISRLENGEHSANRGTLDKIAEALEVPVSQLDPLASDDL
jgi:DNA-binding XRE family transcriptional regulator